MNSDKDTMLLHRSCGIFLLNSEINGNKKRKMWVHEINKKPNQYNKII